MSKIFNLNMKTACFLYILYKTDSKLDRCHLNYPPIDLIRNFI